MQPSPVSGPHPVLGNLKRAFGPNKANARMILYAIPLFVVVGLVFFVGGWGRERARDAFAFVCGGSGMLVVAAGLFWGYRRQLGARAEVYDEGFVWKSWIGAPRAVRWDDVTAVYEFIGYYRHYRHANQWLYTVYTRDGGRVKLSMAVESVSGLGMLVLSETGKRLLPRLLETYRSGGTVQFGAQLGIGRRGFVSGGQVLPWEQTEKIAFRARGDLLIHRKGQRVPWKMLIHSKIANYPVFRALIYEIVPANPADARPLIEDAHPPASPAEPVRGGGIGDISARLGTDVRDLLRDGYRMEDIHRVLDGEITLEELLSSRPRRGR